MITVSVNSNDFQRRFNSLLSTVKNPVRIMKAVGKQAAKEITDNFVRGGANEKWKENSAKTLAKKKGKKVLIDTGNLMKIHSQVVDNGNSVLVGSNQEYGKYHLPEKKTKHKSKGIMPVRDWLDLTAEAEENILDVAVEVLENSLK